MNAKKKRVGPLKPAVPLGEEKQVDGGVELLDDVLDDIFGNDTDYKNDCTGDLIDLDDWAPPVFNEDRCKEDLKDFAGSSESTGTTRQLGSSQVILNSKAHLNRKELIDLDDWDASSASTSQAAISKADGSVDDGFNVSNQSAATINQSKSAVKVMFTSREYEEDPILNIRFSKRELPAAAIKEMSKDMEFLTLTAALKVNEGKNFFTGGVVTAHVPLRKAGSIMTLTDLTSEPCSVRVLLFGTASEIYSKVTLGTVVILTNPRKGKPYNGRESMVVNDDKQIAVAGVSRDYGVCGTRTKAGGTCKNVVNLKLCRYCSMHAIAQFKQQCVGKNLQSVATGKGLLAEKKSKEKSDLWMAPAKSSYSLVSAKVNFNQVQKDRDTLSRLDNENNFSKSFGAALCGKSKKEVGLTSVPKKRKFSEIDCSPVMSEAKRATSTPEPKLSSEQSKIEKLSGFFDHIKTNSFFKQRMSAAKQRALEFARKSGGITPNTEKKPKLEAESPLVRKTKENVLTPEYLALMNEKPSNPQLLAAAEADERNKRFDRLTVIEEIGEKLSQTTEVPVRAIRCLVCEKNYFQMPLQCVKSNHKCRVVATTKRFFQCGGCKKRTTTLERLPTAECFKCGRWNWKKCGVSGDKVCTNAHKLSVRGLEEKFLGSVVTDANLSLLVPDDK